MQKKFWIRGLRALLGAMAVAVLTAGTHATQAASDGLNTEIAAASGANGYLSRTEVLSFIATLQSEFGFESSELERVLGDARYEPRIVQLMDPGRTDGAALPVRSYPSYRARFLKPARIKAGVEFWDAHAVYLERAEAEFGVPAEVILGILGVETAYGRNTGSFRVVDALATIAFDGPRRQEYFRDELKELLLLSREMGVDPLELKGSYAGAVGLPQFMPSSYRRHAVDFDGDGRVDLLGSPADAIGSVASYLKAFGWTPGEIARVTARLPAGSEAALISGLQRSHTVSELRKNGVKFGSDKIPAGECSIVELPGPGATARYFAGFGNFEAITRYNRSTFYATAVLDLADVIRSARQAQVRTAESGRTFRSRKS
jgi:membrane-bound lytic murein transglycosylase B